MNKYIGNQTQLYGVESVRLEGGKGDGMRLLKVYNACGLEFTVSADRCADISKVTFKGDNYSFIAPCGYVSPKYYDNVGAGFLKSFTAGFITTCGLTAVGSPCVDDGEELPLHGTISNTPCENISHWIDGENIHIAATVRDASLFAHHLILERHILVPIYKNEIHITDVIKNIGRTIAPLEVLYHCNMGYPLLSENAVLKIPASGVTPRNEHAASDIDNCLVMEKPQADYEEMCYYHQMSGTPTVELYNPDIRKGLKLTYDTSELGFFTEWKMMGEYEYVLGLEPGNCNPDGRAEMRKSGKLEFLAPGESKTHHLHFEFTEMQ
ncbi:MAG: aldose 1-epimerase family protein [Clostridia bacterium]|nr:aldose 1-epimerase family protein [Clostridia bacterium]